MSYLTLVFRDSPEARELIAREDCRAMSHSHGLNDRDEMKAQRDEMLAALELFVSWGSQDQTTLRFKDIRAIANAAIATARAPKFPMVWCSHCHKGFGPGDQGFSHCESHAGMPVLAD